MLQLRCVIFLSLMFVSTVFSMQHTGTPIVPRASSLNDENKRLVDLEAKIIVLEHNLPMYLKAYEDLTTELDNSQRIVVSNNQVIDSLNHYQASVSALLPFVQKLVTSNAYLFEAAEMGRFLKIYDDIIEAEADCKKKTYGE